MRLMIGADLAPTALNIEEFKKGDIKSLLGDELLALLEDADYRIFNLERALSDTK